MLAIGAVSAADNGTDDNIIGEASGMDLASQDTNEDLTAAEQTFTQLNQTINGNNNSEITLIGDYKYSDVDDFENGIVINRDVTIYGNGHTINGDGRARIFNIAGGNVVFYNIEFTNGYALGSGGAIYGACKAINCNFIKNNANMGGAMYEGTAQNCNFTENTATGVMGSGGAMYRGSARECTFIENSAHVGGAMYYCSAVDCVFKKNSANTGGAVYSGSVVTGTFIGNTALVLAHSMCYACVWNCIGDKDKDFYENKDLVLHWDVSDHFTSEYNSGDALHIVLKSQNDEFVNLIDCNVVVYKDGVMVKTYPCFSGDGLSFDLAAGNYTVEPAVSYLGLKQPSPISIQLTINKAASNIEVSASDAVYPDNVTVNVKSNVSGIYVVKVGGYSKDVTLNAGEAQNVRFSGLSANEVGYVVSVSHESENYTGFNDAVRVKVHKATPTINVAAGDVTYPGDVVVNVKVNVAGTYIVNVGDKSKKLSFVEGVAQNVGFTGLAANEAGYVVNVVYPETQNYAGYTTPNSYVKVHKVTPIVNVSTSDVTYPGDVVVNVNSSAGGNYVVNVGNRSKEVIIVSGIARDVVFDGLAANEVGYVVNVTYAESENYTGYNSSNMLVKVYKATPVVNVTASDVTYPGDVVVSVSVSANGTYVVNVADKSQEVNLTVNGTQNIIFSGLAANDAGYTINVTYAETENYTATFNDGLKVKVKRATSKLIASAKTFKSKDKTKKYLVILKDGKGNAIKKSKIKLKVNGVTYSATTNAKGRAIFHLTKLTKTGKAAISYRGDKNHKVISKKVKLTVKTTSFKTLSYGSKDKAMIKKIQTVLKDKGFYTWAYGHYLKLDGIYHKYTVHAVKLFQKANHLKVTGKVDYKTAQKLKIVK